MKKMSGRRPTPRLFENRPIAELLVPIKADQLHERAVSFAVHLAESWDLPIHLLHVHYPNDVIGDAEVKAADRRLVAAHPHLTVRSSTVENADVALGIRTAATDDSLLIVATDHVSQSTETPSVGVDLVEAADGVLMFCGPHCGIAELERSVVVALDGSLHAEAAVEIGVSMAQSADAKLWLVNVVDETTVAQVEKLKASGQRVSESGYLRQVSDQLASNGIDNGWEIVHNADPVAGLVNFAESRGASFIVASSHGHSELAGRVFGSVCLGLVERSTRPVIVVKR